MGPEPGLIGLGDSESPRDPEQDVVMRPPPLRKLKDPLIPNSNSRSCAESFETLKEPGDLRRLPLVVPAVREREKKAVGTEAPARESSPCGLSASHDDAAHPSNAAPLLSP